MDKKTLNESVLKKTLLILGAASTLSAAGAWVGHKSVPKGSPPPKIRQLVADVQSLRGDLTKDGFKLGERSMTLPSSPFKIRIPAHSKVFRDGIATQTGSVIIV
jgi:hypothetical protein